MLQYESGTVSSGQSARDARVGTGGPSVAKILVADDNSNIQKMVGLALKDQGIDVVAVGNGEAAVRKISDVKPDLVLADVFMPVRNGYEVCKYVKDDSALAHIPVILLVGAFDPLDEQEAQRVGADGVLKKPFVPPDPLISMVKSALSRAGVVVGAHAEPPPPPPVSAEFKPLALHTAPPPPPAFEEPVEDIPVRPAPISIDRTAQPLAFGSLLETPGTAQEEDTSELVSSTRVERDWKSTEEEQMDVEEEQEEPANSWRPGGTDMDVDDIPAGKKDWREVAFANIKDSVAKSSHSAVEEEPELVGAEEVNSDAPSAYAAEDTRSETVTKEAEAEIQQVTEAAKWIPAPTSIEMADAIAIQEATVIVAPPPVPVPEVVPVPAAVAPAAPDPVPVAKENSSWMSVPPSPWEAEVAKASKLAATWDTASVAVAPEPPPQEVVQEPEPEAVSAGIPAVTEQAIREETVQVVEEVAHEIEEPVTQSSQPQAAEPVPAAPPNVDDIVAKVLSKMDPSALQAMTKELLKPVIESIVREELNRK